MMSRWCASPSAASTWHQDVDDALEGEEALLVDDAREVLPAQELHHQVELAAVLAEVDDARPSSGG